MSIAWGVLAPAAIVLAYNFKNVPPTNMWFHAHRALMVRLSLYSFPFWIGFLKADPSSLQQCPIDLQLWQAGTLT